MIGYGGFGMANAMFTIVPIFIGVVFVLILAGIAVQAVRGAAQWKRNNDAPVLTVEAEVAAKRMDVRTYRHGETVVPAGCAVARGRLTFQGTRFQGFRRT